MKKIKSNKVINYVMNDEVWKIDTPSFLKEVCENSKYTAYKASFQVFQAILCVLTERACEINDPALNIIMLNLSLYEGSHGDKYNEYVKAMRDKINQIQK